MTTAIDYQQLYQMACTARQAAYAPYSHFAVGACLLAADGRTFVGCNVENATYGATICAERVAFGRAVADGAHAFVAIAVVGGEEEPLRPCVPCGICLQVMSEFCEGNFQVIAYEDGEPIVRTLKELLPVAFALEE